TASPRLREFIMRNVESYDAVIVSTKRDLEGLIHAGYRGKAYQIYPYIDPEKWGEVEEKELEETLANFGIQEDDEIILVVARMDRIKGQDTAVKAFSLVRKKHPHAKLFLVGDGSFTSSGLGHSKGENWRRELKKTAQQLKVEDFVNFLGYVEEKKLKCLYSRADVVLLPSIMEGFGLTVVEAWNYMKPVVVSRGAGVSELILEKVNGLTHEPQNYEDLAEKIDYVLEHKEEALKMGQVGYETAKQCSISGAMERLKTVFETVLEKY
ncbi:glycosyltransferase family 1 protein, partial [Candidatus Bathyarchaeota archaeon]